MTVLMFEKHLDVFKPDDAYTCMSLNWGEIHTGPRNTGGNFVRDFCLLQTGSHSCGAF